MPTYDYQCTACGHKYERFESITATPDKKCPSCNRRTARRLIGTGAGIIFKGSGFYQTDYRSESYKKAAKAESESISGGKKEKAGDSTKGKAAGKTSASSES